LIGQIFFVAVFFDDSYLLVVLHDAAARTIFTIEQLTGHIIFSPMAQLLMYSPKHSVAVEQPAELRFGSSAGARTIHESQNRFSI
jgi:hypothetical protein